MSKELIETDLFIYTITALVLSSYDLLDAHKSILHSNHDPHSNVRFGVDLYNLYIQQQNITLFTLSVH
jgi:hypothetical protein